MKTIVSLWLALLALAACASAPQPVLKSVAMNEAAINGKHWVAEVAGDIDAAQRPRLEFLRDGRLAGYSGCNVVSGTWRMEGDAVRLGALAMTKRGCIGPAGDVEKRFLAAVNERSSFTLEGARLVAKGAAGEPMRFVERPSGS
jgi:heat shock protein HslJ